MSEAYRKVWHVGVGPLVAKDEGCHSAPLFTHFDANSTSLRLPFERIDAATYEEMQSVVVKRRVSGDLFEALQRNNHGELT